MGAGGNTMKIELTEHEQALIVDALVGIDTVIGTHLANKILSQNNADPTNDGPEVAAIRHLRQLEGWDQ
jgi:hypothetical protein